MAFYGNGKHNENIGNIDTEFHFSVDIPSQFTDEWICMDYFETKEKAIEYAQEYFGADENGMVCLISKF